MVWTPPWHHPVLVSYSSMKTSRHQIRNSTTAVVFAYVFFQVLTIGVLGQSAGNSFKILPGPAKVANGWRITWNSVAGAQYKLQRLEGDSITFESLKWIDVQNVTASADTATGVDLSPGARQRFYRVVLEASDDISPTIGILRADPGTAKSEGIVVLS